MSRNIDEAWDDIVFQEDRCAARTPRGRALTRILRRLLDAGWEEGLNAGERAGSLEGRAMGVANGHRIGMEVGFYLGIVDACRRALNVSDTRRERVMRAVDSLEAASLAVPAHAGDEELQEALERVRGRYRLLNALLPAEQRIKFGSATSKLSF